MASKEEFFRMALRSPRGEMRINSFREQIKTRKDRADPNWMQTIQYDPNYDGKDPKRNQTIDYELTTNRQINEVHSKYPIRQSLKPYTPLNKPS